MNRAERRAHKTPKQTSRKKVTRSIISEAHDIYENWKKHSNLSNRDLKKILAHKNFSIEEYVIDDVLSLELSVNIDGTVYRFGSPFFSPGKDNNEAFRQNMLLVLLHITKEFDDLAGTDGYFNDIAREYCNEHRIKLQE